jgi:putative membrane protein
MTLSNPRIAWLAAVSLLSLAGCQQAEKAATDVKSAAQAQTNPTLSTSDVTFINTAATAGVEEVKFGQLAETKATTPAIRGFAAQMVKDHTAVNEKLTTLATRKQLTAPTSMDTMHESAYDTLKSSKGRAFNKLYMDGQVQDHRQVVQVFKDEAQNGTDPDVKAFAQETLPTLEHHLQLAQRLDPKG